MKVEVEMRNTPTFDIPINVKGYIVARLDNGELWYYGLFESKEKAKTIARQIGNGVVMKKGEE